jgi:4-hydroxy-2-oxoheptanedioate aldolase
VSDRLNGIIRQLAKGDTAFLTFSSSSKEDAVSLAISDYDGVVVEMEHEAFSPSNLRDYFQYLLDRRAIAEAGIAPPITPLVRIPVNGNEYNQWIAKQVLDLGAYGVIWPHIDTVAEARNAVESCRYPRKGSPGHRGFRPWIAARYFGTSVEEYITRAGVWPLDEDGEILVVIMIESALGLSKLAEILDNVPGIGAVLMGLGDLAIELGHGEEIGHPEVHEAALEAIRVCDARNVACGRVVSHGNADSLVEENYRLVLTRPLVSYQPLSDVRAAVGRRAHGQP